MEREIEMPWMPSASKIFWSCLANRMFASFDSPVHVRESAAILYRFTLKVQLAIADEVTGHSISAI